MDATTYMISTAFRDNGPIRSINYKNEYEIIFVENGEIELHVGNKIYVAKENHLVLLSNLEQQQLKLLSPNGCSRYCVFFHAPVVDSYLRNPEILSLLKNHSDIFQHCLNVEPIKDFVVDILQKMLNCNEASPYANEMIAACLTTLLIQLCWLYPEMQPHNLKGICQSRIYAVQRYLDKHYMEQIKIADVSAQHYISVHYLSRQFKSLTGYSPKQYLMLLRLKHAAVMLHDTKLPVNEIATNCGFSDINNFCKQFKQEYRCTPSKFRSDL